MALPASSCHAPADWQLPPGVDRGLWDYLHDDALARGYDAGLAGSSLFTLDIAFVREQCARPGRLIDLGCGTGRLLVPLARDGWRVLGIDLSAAMLAVAAEKARAAGAAVDLIRANITELDFLQAEQCDAVACLFSTLGMVRDATQRLRVVAGAYRLLRPGGRFLLHVHNRWFNLWDRSSRGWLLADLVGWREPGLERGDRRMPPHQGIAGLTLHLFTRSEIVGLLRGAGFRVMEVRPISLAADGRLRCPWWLGSLRAYGWLIAAEKQ
jgi:SAM-dependent methyltransferase